MASPGIAKNEEEDLWRDTASAWGSLYTKYGDIVANEKVILISESANQTYSEISDENGYFNFENIVPASDYRLSVSPKGMYKRVSMDSLAILNNQAALAIVLEPLELGTLKGKVVNTEGIVVPGYQMRIQSPLKTRWIRNFVPDIIGEFEIENVSDWPDRVYQNIWPGSDDNRARVFGGLANYNRTGSGCWLQRVEGVWCTTNSLTRFLEQRWFWIGNTITRGVISIVTRRSTTSPTGGVSLSGPR